jgi:hypothetical protein
MSVWEGVAQGGVRLRDVLPLPDALTKIIRAYAKETFLESLRVYLIWRRLRVQDLKLEYKKKRKTEEVHIWHKGRYQVRSLEGFVSELTRDCSWYSAIDDEHTCRLLREDVLRFADLESKTRASSVFSRRKPRSFTHGAAFTGRAAVARGLGEESTRRKRSCRVSDAISYGTSASLGPT